MSCFKTSFSSLLSPLKRRKTRKTVHDAYAPKYFMDGNATTISTFEAADDDSFLDGNMSSEKSSIGDESILASSHQNSTMNLPISAPSSIARNQIQACSTPKDEITGQGKIKNISGRPVMKGSTPFAQCQDKRILYRASRMRNLAKSPENNGEPVPRTCYMYVDATPPIHKRRQAYIEEKERERIEAELKIKDDLIDKHGNEYFSSFVIVIWQFFYLLNIIPNDNSVCYYLNLALCASYSLVFMAPQLILWAIASCSFIVYMTFAWLFGAGFAYGTLAFLGIFVKAIENSIEGIKLIRSY